MPKFRSLSPNVGYDDLQVLAKGPVLDGYAAGDHGWTDPVWVPSHWFNQMIGGIEIDGYVYCDEQGNQVEEPVTRMPK